MDLLPLLYIWWALALGANIGANGTLIGTASNLIVADITEKNKQPIPFWYFVKVAFPLVILKFFHISNLCLFEVPYLVVSE